MSKAPKHNQTEAKKFVQMYALCCPDSGDVRYIGKAVCAKKRLSSHLRDARRRNTPVYCWIRKLQDSGKLPVMKVLDSAVAASEWESVERRLIADARVAGARLLNLADGGNAPQCSPEVCSRNGRNAGKRNPIIFWLLRTVGAEISARRKSGDGLGYLEEAMRVVRKLDADARNRFEQRWIAAGHYYPGRP